VGNVTSVKGATVAGNLMVIDGNHHLTGRFRDCTIVNNTLVGPDPDDIATPAYSDGLKTIRLEGATSASISEGGNLVQENVYETAVDSNSQSGNTLNDNSQMGADGVTYAYASEFEGPAWANNTFSLTKTAFVAKTGSHALSLGLGAGAIGTNYGVYGNVRDSVSWSYDASREAYTPPTPPTMTNPDLITTQPQSALDIIKADCDTLNALGVGTSTITASDLTNALNTTAGEIAVQKTNQDNLNTDNALGLTLTVPIGDFVDQFQTLYDNNVAIEAVI